MKFLHVTDTHLLKPGVQNLGLDPAERLRACVADILAEHADAQFCVITGDIAHWGEAQAYGSFAQIMASLPMPLHILLGNHDDRETFKACLPQVEVDSNGFIQTCIDQPDGRYLMLDTLDPGKPSGIYCVQLQGWLRARLDSAGEQPVYLFMHHPPFDLGIPALDRIGLANQGEFAALVAGRRNIRHLFFGHAHRPISGSWQGIPISTLFGTAHQVALDIEDRGLLRYTQEDPCYGVVLVNDDAVIVHQRNYLAPPVIGVSDR